MDKLDKVKKNPAKVLAVEVIALNPLITNKEVAIKVGVGESVITSWRKDPNFIDVCYERYMVEFGSLLPSVLNAMVREAQAGNVQAGRLVLEHFGKLDNKLKITIESPYEKILKSMDITDAEYIEDIDSDILNYDGVDSEVIDNLLKGLPERDIRNDNPSERIKTERKELNKKVSEKMRQHKMYLMRKRAKAVGLEVLGKGKKTKGERKAWMDELERLEIAKFGAIQSD